MESIFKESQAEEIKYKWFSLAEVFMHISPPQNGDSNSRASTDIINLLIEAVALIGQGAYF